MIRSIAQNQAPRYMEKGYADHCSGVYGRLTTESDTAATL